IGQGEVPDTDPLEQVGPVAPGRKADVRCHREVGEKPVVLGQIPRMASFGAEVDAPSGVKPQLTAEGDAAGTRTLETGNRAQQRRLTGARGTDQADGLGADAQCCAKLERSPGKDDVDVELIHERISSLDVKRIAALTIINRTPIAIAWSRLASNREYTASGSVWVLPCRLPANRIVAPNSPTPRANATAAAA